MSCCGNKRREWLNESKNKVAEKSGEQVSSATGFDKPKPNKIVEYTGNYSLNIIGVISGKTYSFKHKGDTVEVNYEDSFAMMAERDLKIFIKE